MSEKKLRLGVLIDSYKVPAWAYNSIERIANSDSADFRLVILNDGPTDDSYNMGEYWGGRNSLVYSIFSKIDEMLFRREPNAFEMKNLEELLADVPSMKVKPIQREHSEHFQTKDVENIRDYKLDILVKMGFKILRGEILDSAKYGVWSYHHADSRVNRGGPPGFWETVEKWPETATTLQILNDDLTAEKVLFRSWSPTYRFSPCRNKNLIFWASSTFLSRQIKRLYLLGEEQYFKEIEKLNQELNFFYNREYKTPSNTVALTLMLRYLGRLILGVCKKAFTIDQWYLMFDLKQDIATPFNEFRKIIPPKDRFWSDPHVVGSDENYYTFIEEYIYKKKKGHISVIAMDKHGNYKDPVPILEKDYHLSYPFVFQWEGKHYMVPETRNNRTVELYECTDFPDVWEFKMNLMENIYAVDATLLHKDDIWWLFVAMSDVQCFWPPYELFIFFSDKFFSNRWKPHPLNPVVSDVKQARPAGRIFTKNNKIYRPSQDGSVRYGHGFDINEIVCLSETEYAEKQIISVKPNWDKRVIGTHTYANDGRLTIIDACINRKKIFHFKDFL